MIDILKDIWPQIVAVAAVAIMLLAVAHVVLNKRDSRAAVGWAGVIILFPFVGSLLYVLLGINRIKRKATNLRGKPSVNPDGISDYLCSHDELATALPGELKHLTMLENAVSRITKHPLLKGNDVTPLRNGDEAYPAMMEAIKGAKESISMATYIFGNDKAGDMFIDSLSEAVKRGVDVKFLIDYVGARYSFPSAVGKLKRAGIQVERFMPTAFPLRTKYLNLRNHRKILVVDGKTGFTGGMNIRIDNMLEENPRRKVRDMHFKLTGPVVKHLQVAFAEDWLFSTGERLQDNKWFPEIKEDGPIIARGITDGPDEDFEKQLNVIMAALACAEKSVRIVTPYFLPENELIGALNVTSMRGVDIEILIPEKSNLRMVGWATNAQIWQVLQWNCRIWISPEPFDHSKIMIIDDNWCLVGSANWDARSLRLNFEFNVECYSKELAEKLNKIADDKRSKSRELKLDEIRSRPMPQKLRDSAARLFTPYL